MVTSIYIKQIIYLQKYFPGMTFSKKNVTNIQYV